MQSTHFSEKKRWYKESLVLPMFVELNIGNQLTNFTLLIYLNLDVWIVQWVHSEIDSKNVNNKL